MARINFKTAAKKARAIRKKNPHMQWSTAMAEAIRSMQKKKTRRVSGVKKKSAPRKRAATIKKIKTFHAKEGRAIRSLGSVSSHLHHAKKILEEKIGRLAVEKFKSTSKVKIRMINKRIAELKSRYKKLSS